MSGDLNGKVALITGGGTGLGLEIAAVLAELGAKAVSMPCDVRDHHAVRRTVKRTVEELGSLDILVNNAGCNFLRPAENLPEKAFAVEWARHRIRVVAIAPGPFDSEAAANRLWPSRELEERVRSGIPLGRLGSAEEIARAAAWLVTDEAGYVTGECLTMDGGHWLSGGILGPGEEIPKVRRRRKDREPGS